MFTAYYDSWRGMNPRVASLNWRRAGEAYSTQGRLLAPAGLAALGFGLRSSAPCGADTMPAPASHALLRNMPRQLAHLLNI